MVLGVYVAGHMPDSLELRCQALRLVLPPTAVVTDRTAGWLHGAPMILAPNDHLAVPAVSAFQRGRGSRLRNGLCASGQRLMPDTDVMEVHGVLVTTPLRTALDLGRLLRRPQAFGALDSMLGLRRFDSDSLVGGVRRFKGFRGVRQLRSLAPLADGRAESPPESALRLMWLDCADLPAPQLQIPVETPWGEPYRLDLGIPELRYAAEYDGAEWHGPDRLKHDAERREWIAKHAGWDIDVFKRTNVFGTHADADITLRVGVRRARRTAWLRSAS